MQCFYVITPREPHSGCISPTFPAASGAPSVVGGVLHARHTPPTTALLPYSLPRSAQLSVRQRALPPNMTRTGVASTLKRQQQQTHRG